MSDFHDIGDHYDLGGSHHDAGAHHMSGHYGSHQGGIGQGQGIMGVLNHFLGNDINHDAAHNAHSHHNHAGSTDPAHVQTTDTMNGSRWGQFFAGLPVTPTMLFATLFGGMTLWLGVVYFLSHNNGETAVVKHQSSHADRVLLAGTRNAMPMPQRQNYAQYSAEPSPAVQEQPASSTLISALPGAIEARPISPVPVMAQAAPMPYTINPGYNQHYPDVRSYSVHVQTAEGPRLKTIVNR